MSQNRITILSTAEIDQALITEAAEKNIEVAVSPFIRTEAIKSAEVQQEIESALLESLIVIFTSKKAVEAVAEELKGQMPDPIAIGWKIYCTLGATKQAVEKYFGNNSIKGTAENSKELAALMIEEAGDNQVFFFCGDHRRTELPDILRRNEMEVTEVVVYQTILLPHQIETSYDGILFFSPSGVRSFFQKNKPPDKSILFAIGETTENEIKRFSTNKIIVSDEPARKSLLAKAINFFQEIYH